MLLTRIELCGFKSFVERTIIEVREGITVIIGPNGCGKSNIIDAIRWVFGEQSPRSLRINHQTELLFNGSKAHPAVNFAEVSIIFDNSDNSLQLDISEVSVTRRLYRNGEGGYYLNGRPVSLKHIRTLFSNLGVGFSPYSILEQGQTDRILVAKPEMRREIFEEAAGIRGYRTQFAESNRKLAKVQQQMREIRPMLQEIERTYHHRKEQWKRLQTYRTLESQRAELVARKAFVEYQKLETQRIEREAHRDRLKQKSREMEEHDEQRRRDSHQFQQQLETLYSDQEKNRERVHEIRLHIEREKGKIASQQDHIKQIDNHIAEQNKWIRDSFAQAEHMSTQHEQLGKQIAETEHAHATLKTEQKKKREEQEALRTRKNTYNERKAHCEQKIASFEQQQQKLRKKIAILSQEIVVQLDQLLADNPNMSARAIIENPQLSDLLQKNQHLISRMNTILDDYHAMNTDSSTMSKQIIDQITKIAVSLQKSYAGYMNMRNIQLKTVSPLFALLADPDSNFAVRHKLDREYTQVQEQIAHQRSEVQRISSEYDKNEQHLQNITDHLHEEAMEYERQRMHIENLIDKKKQLIKQTELQKGERDRVHSRVSRYRDQQVEIKNTISNNERHLKEHKTALTKAETHTRAIAAKIERIRKDIGNTDQQSDKIHQHLQKITEQLDRAVVAHSKIVAKIDIVTRQFREQFGSDIRYYQLTTSDEAGFEQSEYRDPSVEIMQIANRIEQLGKINMMAQDEFVEAENRYTNMNKHYQDLVQAQQNLDQVTKEINRQSSERLVETISAISAHFSEICNHFFSESNGNICLSTPDQPLSSDISIIIQPQGKKNERIEHLSGGERVMASLALLFALYRHNPSHVTFLDEIDAALDADNVVRVAHYIRDHLTSTQSIIITHNRQTISIAHTIVGITMERYGISQTLEISLEDYMEEEHA